MSHFNEHTLEMAIMELFEQQGYSYVNGEKQRRLVVSVYQLILIPRNENVGQKPIIGSWRKLSSIKKSLRSLSSST
jgi:hypothetical protein